MRTHTKETQDKLTPDLALEILKEGNGRFMQNLKANRNLLQQVNETSEGQYPFAVILSCIDSRAPVELIFDQGLGDVFSIRVAGNVINDDILGSMEFACKVAGSKLVVVLGHSSCGAVKGACASVQLGNLTGLLNKINPAIREVKGSGETLDETQFVQKVAEKNVELVKEQILANSPVLSEMISEGDIGIVGGMYSVETGEVKF
ncbi:MAG: carbonic anhydrase family protein [Cyclobacteriaceae bacterium]